MVYTDHFSLIIAAEGQEASDLLNRALVADSLDNSYV